MLGLLDRLEQRVPLPNVLVDEQRVPGVQKLLERELVNVSSRERYAALDEAAVFPRPEAEGEGVCVGRSDCSPIR